jgi:acyl carrier protein
LDIETVIKNWFQEKFSETLSNDTDFTKLYGFDSLSFAELLLHIETTFNISLNFDEIDNWNALTSLKTLIEFFNRASKPN